MLIPTLLPSSEPRQFNDQDGEDSRVKIMRVIEEHYARHGKPPSFRAIRRLANMTSMNGVFTTVDRLIAEGYLTKRDGKLRLTNKRMFI